MPASLGVLANPRYLHQLPLVHASNHSLHRYAVSRNGHRRVCRSRASAYRGANREGNRRRRPSTYPRLLELAFSGCHLFITGAVFRRVFRLLQIWLSVCVHRPGRQMLSYILPSPRGGIDGSWLLRGDIRRFRSWPCSTQIWKSTFPCCYGESLLRPYSPRVGLVDDFGRGTSCLGIPNRTSDSIQSGV